jgi:hypothetical protein
MAQLHRSVVAHGHTGLNPLSGLSHAASMRAARALEFTQHRWHWKAATAAL